MARNAALVATAAAQLTAGLVGEAIAARRGRPSDPMLGHWNLPRDHMVRNAIVLGTGQSAPNIMMMTQAVAAAQLARDGSPRARRTLGVLGAIMIGGYLIERETPLWSGHRDALATPVFATGLAGAIAMALLGLRGGDR
ncbi:hypothetical protein [Knoellia sinensis]|nr:hypothetical protein [Knoellia sinensis]